MYVHSQNAYHHTNFGSEMRLSPRMNTSYQATKNSLVIISMCWAKQLNSTFETMLMIITRIDYFNLEWVVLNGGNINGSYRQISYAFDQEPCRHSGWCLSSSYSTDYSPTSDVASIRNESTSLLLVTAMVAPTYWFYLHWINNTAADAL